MNRPKPRPSFVWPIPRRASRVLPGLGAGLVWLVLGVLVAYWGWRAWGHQAPVALPPADVPALGGIDGAAVARALGAGPAPTVATEPTAAPGAPDGGLALSGLAQDAQGRGVALLGVSGQPAVAYRVGALVADTWRLQTLDPDGVTLQDTQQPERRVRLRLALPTP